ncbi:sigma-70 family RNA polymerase sigma factor [Parabacteroides faecis]|uniref:RNA polymerase sigma factor n=1 Tax=Parabacteroides faecis TaxID=1217282 RepID=UPI002164AD75|nr:sigma-70 family RNA polymerase sigma factor [Parabacteroides faecis]MCS2890893.1 sigma-70 family RNA polymerase sigma factor [Parabacteroides faecis]UVQ45450.1 sigma-70 family RNA polymerase sigma factor [Parabacteroides faecis]
MRKNTESTPVTAKERHSDQIIWENFLCGDDEAYTYIYREYSQALYAYGMHFTSDKGLVEDCIQDVFVKIFQNRKHLQSTDNIKLYLFISLKNKLFNIFRKDIKYSQIDSLEPVFAAEYTIEDEIIENEKEQFLNEKMIRMLEVLSPRQKEIIYYRFVEGLSYEEICQIMDMNYQSTQNLIQRSLKKLRTTFSRAEMQFVLFLLISI